MKDMGVWDGKEEKGVQNDLKKKNRRKTEKKKEKRGEGKGGGERKGAADNSDLRGSRKFSNPKISLAYNLTMKFSFGGTKFSFFHFIFQNAAFFAEI